MNVAVFGSSTTPADHPDFGLGVEVGRLLGEGGHAVFTGGYGGLMEAVSQGAAAAGARVVGVTASAVFPGRSGANRHVVEIVDAPTLSERIHWIVSETDAAVALPGSIGTLTELMVAWNVAYVARFSGRRPKPVITIGAFWREMVSGLAESLETDRELVTCLDAPVEIIEILLRHGEKRYP